jgi:hypothetical protein
MGVECSEFYGRGLMAWYIGEPLIYLQIFSDIFSSNTLLFLLCFSYSPFIESVE